MTKLTVTASTAITVRTIRPQDTKQSLTEDRLLRCLISKSLNEVETKVGSLQLCANAEGIPLRTGRPGHDYETYACHDPGDSADGRGYDCDCAVRQAGESAILT